MQISQKNDISSSPAVFLSVSFWLLLSLALGLYGLAVLSPKLAGREQLLADYQAQQIQLLREEQQLARLHQVTLSLQQDSRFVENLLRRDLKFQLNGEEILPVEGALVFRETETAQETSTLLTIRSPPWYAPVLTAIGHSSDIRGVLLLSSVVLIMFAFGFLQLPAAAIEPVSPIASEEMPHKPSFLVKWLSRYDRSAEEAEDEERQRLLERLARMESEADWERDALPVDASDEDEV